MSKSVFISIQPYYVFLIIAKAMGWDIPQEKTIEVRKTVPKDKDWDKKVIIYCSKNKKSFAKIAKEYQSLMKQHLGKVIGEFVCNCIGKVTWNSNVTQSSLKKFYNEETCLTDKEVWEYTKGNSFYEWHISNLVIYDKPRDLDDFMAFGKSNCDCKNCDNCLYMGIDGICDIKNRYQPLFRPPQSWCYVEELI